jgi:hypothetical protein
MACQVGNGLGKALLNAPRGLLLGTWVWMRTARCLSGGRVQVDDRPGLGACFPAGVEIGSTFVYQQQQDQGLSKI